MLGWIDFSQKEKWMVSENCPIKNEFYNSLKNENYLRKDSTEQVPSQIFFIPSFYIALLILYDDTFTIFKTSTYISSKILLCHKINCAFVHAYEKKI